MRNYLIYVMDFSISELPMVCAPKGVRLIKGLKPKKSAVNVEALKGHL